MTPIEFVLFITGLISPIIYQRTKYKVNSISFLRTPLRSRSKLQIHHGHWGLLLEFVAVMLLVFGFHNMMSIGLAGLGWGLMLDEIVPMLKMPPPNDRMFELRVYQQSKTASIILVAAVVALSLLLFIVTR